MDEIIEMLKLLSAGETLDHNGWTVRCIAVADAPRALVVHPSDEPLADLSSPPVGRGVRASADESGFLLVGALLCVRPPSCPEPTVPPLPPLPQPSSLKGATQVPSKIAVK